MGWRGEKLKVAADLTWLTHYKDKDIAVIITDRSESAISQQGPFWNCGLPLRKKKLYVFGMKFKLLCVLTMKLIFWVAILSYKHYYNTWVSFNLQLNIEVIESAK